MGMPAAQKVAPVLELRCVAHRDIPPRNQSPCQSWFYGMSRCFSSSRNYPYTPLSYATFDLTRPFLYYAAAVYACGLVPAALGFTAFESAYC
jgi:hypothetical protein